MSAENETGGQAQSNSETKKTESPKADGQEKTSEDKPKETKSNDGQGNTVGLSGEHIDAPNARIANQINDTRKSYHYYQAGEATSVPLSPEEHFEAFGTDRLNRLLQEMLFDRGQLEQLTKTLEETRILTLVGRPEMGKASLALLTAARLQQRYDLHGAMLCRALDGNVRVDPNELTGDVPEYHGHVIIIKNAFSRARSDLSRFVEGLTGLRLESYRERLAACNTFLVLTASQADRHRGLDFLREISPPSTTILRQGLERRVRQWFLERPPGGDHAVVSPVEDLLRDQGESIAAHLGSLSRIDRFVREYLADVVSGRLSLADALERIDDLDRWLLTDLPCDPETWYAVLALTLCSAAPMPQSVPWLQFEGLRRALSRFFVRELHETRRPRTIQDLCQGWTLARARAEMVRSRFPEPQGIRFQVNDYPNRLWQALLGSGRSLLSLLLPLLRELADGKDTHLRQCAARALGRIGQIDPPYVIRAFVHRALENTRSIPLGHLYQGILGSEDPSYRDGCLADFRELLRGDDEEATLAIRSLRQIGMLDLGFALQELRAIAEDRLEVRWTELRNASTILRSIEELIRNVVDPVEFGKHLRSIREMCSQKGLLVILELIRKIENPGDVAVVIRELREDSQWLLTTEMVSEETQRTLQAIQFVITGLFDSLPDHGPLLRELLTWIQSEKKDAGALVGFLFLHPGGLAPFLEGVSSSTEGPDRRFCSPVLHGARSDPEAAASLRDLLQEVFLQLGAFPGAFRHQMEERFRNLLAAWAREAKDLAAVRPVMVDLLAGLFESRHNELSSWVLRLARDPEAKKEDEALKALSIEAITSRRTPQRAVSAA